MNVRDAFPTDLPTVVDIYNAAIPGRTATADLEPVSVEARRDWFDRHRQDRYPIWVAERDDRVVGWLDFRPFYGRPAYAATAELAVYVAPDCQGQGIGTQLLRQAIARGASLQLKTLLAIIFAHNLPSLALFERAGFSEWGYLPRIARLDDVERDVLILGKRL